MRFVALLLLFTTPCFAELNIEGPESCNVGELVRLSATGVENLKWSIRPSTTDFEVVGNRAFFSGRRPSEFLVVIAGAKDNTPFLKFHELTVERESSPTTLDLKISRWLKQVQSDNKIEEAKKLASAFRALSVADIEVEKILEETAKATREALDGSLQAWIPFLDALTLELDRLQEAEKLETRSQFQKMWVKIADSIEKETHGQENSP